MPMIPKSQWVLLALFVATTVAGCGGAPNPVEPLVVLGEQAESETSEDAEGRRTGDWIIVPGERVGRITAATTATDLISVYGATNVRNEEVYLGEGFSEMGTGLYLSDESKTLRILWQDPEEKARPASIQITGATSVWKTEAGITLGTPLTKVQELNGKPFKLFGFEWDYGGTLSDGNNGNIKGLAHEDPEKGFLPAYLSLTFQPDYEGKPDFPQEKMRQVSGDTEFSSDHPVMQELDPLVYSITVSFPDPEE